MKTATLCLFILLCFISSCNNSSVYNKNNSNFPDNRWLKVDAKEFDFTIEDDSKLYDITFNFRHVYDYQFETVPMIFTIINPNQQEQVIAVDLKIKDATGKDAGDCLSDICDLKYKLKQKTKLEKGSYKIIVSQTFNYAYLPNVSQIGLDVSFSK